MIEDCEQRDGRMVGLLFGPISTGSPEAANWLVGLADGLIIPSDVTSRLAVQDRGRRDRDGVVVGSEPVTS